MKLTLVGFAALSMLTVGTGEAFALFAGPAPCTVGETNCVGDDPDDPTAGHLVDPTDYGKTTTYDGDTGAPTTTPNPAPTPATQNSDGNPIRN